MPDRRRAFQRFDLACVEVHVKLAWEWWIQVWPNLAASALVWLPAFIWHHRKINAHVSNEIAKAVSRSDGSA